MPQTRPSQPPNLLDEVRQILRLHHASITLSAPLERRASAGGVSLVCRTPTCLRTARCSRASAQVYSLRQARSMAPNSR